jgi:hypothetical protein|eukprot:COSAG01_NODE_5385_length_4293_cov_19.521221_3_plen_117_part_00
MAAQVVAYNANMQKLWSTIVDKGGFAWDLFGGGAFHGVGMKESSCRSVLGNICSANNRQDSTAAFYKMNPCRDLSKPCPLLEKGAPKAPTDDEMCSCTGKALLLDRGVMCGCPTRR